MQASSIRQIHRGLALLTVALGASAVAQEAGEWETVATRPVLIKRRNVAGSAIKEVWGEGTLAASVADIQAALTDVPRFTDYLPYCHEARELEPDADGGRYVYQRFDLPAVIASRDLIHKTFVDRNAATDPGGAFANHWFAAPDRMPERKGFIRLRLSEGSWLVEPRPDGTSHVVYRLRVDPGGMVPAFVVNIANKDGVLDTFKSVEAQARKRPSVSRGPAVTERPNN